ATIDWGDGSSTTTAGVITATSTAGTFTISAGTTLHKYADEGSYTFKVTVTQLGGSTVSSTGTATVTDAALTGSTSATAAGTEGAGSSSVLSGATFTDANPGDHTGDFTATITWGDGGATSAGTVSYSNGTYTVNGSHTYAD